MADVLRLALERRDHLHAEIQRLDEFIRTAEQLIRAAHPTPRPVMDPVMDGPDEPGAMRTNRTWRSTQAATG